MGALRPLMPPGEWEWLADRWVGLQAMVVVGHSQALPTPNSTTLSFQKRFPSHQVSGTFWSVPG